MLDTLLLEEPLLSPEGPEATFLPVPFAVPVPPAGADRRAVRFAPRRHRRTARDRPTLPATPGVFSWIGERLTPGEATLWVGTSPVVEQMLETVYAGNALVEGAVSLVEGGNRFNPYRVGERGRAVGADPSQVMARIRLARAFTAYQLVALVDRWVAEARRHPPTLLVAHDLPALFFTSEVPAEERTPLLTHVARTLRTLVETTGLPLLLTFDGGWSRFPGLSTVGPRLAELLVFEAPTARGSVVRSRRDGRSLRLVARPDGQRGIEEFADPGGEEVIAWDGPPRRTGKRWRSG